MHLDNVAIKDVYLWYDGPCLYLGEDPEGNLYLVVLTDETPEYQEWLYSAVSEPDLKEVLSMNLSLYQAFKYPSTGNAYLVRKSMDTDEIIFSKEMVPSELGDNLLPSREAYLDLVKVDK